MSLVQCQVHFRVHFRVHCLLQQGARALVAVRECLKISIRPLYLHCEKLLSLLPRTDLWEIPCPLRRQYSFHIIRLKQNLKEVQADVGLSALFLMKE